MSLRLSYLFGDIIVHLDSLNLVLNSSSLDVVDNHTR